MSCSILLALKSLILTCRVDCGSRVHTLLQEVGRGFAAAPFSCPRPLVIWGQSLYKEEEQGQGGAEEQFSVQSEPRRKGKLGVRMHIKPRSTKAARRLKSPLGMLQLDTQARALHRCPRPCPTSCRTGRCVKEGGKHWFSYLCALPLCPRNMHASGKPNKY